MSDIEKNSIKDEELEQINGGTSLNNGVPTKNAWCPKCHKNRKFYIYSGGQAVCSECNEKITL